MLGEPTQAKASGFLFTFEVIFYYAFASLLLFIIGRIDSSADLAIYLQYLVSPIAILCAAIWYFAWTKFPIKQWAKRQICHPKYYFLAIVLQIGLLSLSELNTLFLSWLERFGYQPLPVVLPSMDGMGIVGVLLVVAVLPAVCEELLFRGLLMDGIKVFGTLGAVLLCGGLFALYHQSPTQTVYQFCCGVAFALIAIRSGSILPTVLSHFLNNATIILLAKFEVHTLPKPVFITMLCISVPCLILSLAYLIWGDKKGDEKQVLGTKKQFLLGSAIGVVLCAVVWLTILITGL